MISNRHYRRGFLLLEAMIASLILLVAAVGIASLLLAAHEQQISIQELNTATLLAKQLMEEIATEPLGVYPPVAQPAHRSQFTTANQYANYADSTGAGISTLGGVAVPYPAIGNYSRSVAISDTTVTQTLPHDIRLVIVTVNTPTGKTVSINKWMTNVNWGF